jgi:hypothetical protein
MIRYSKVHSILTFCLLLQLGTQGAFAWILPSSPTTTTRTAPIRVIQIRSSTPLYSSPLNSDQEDHPSSFNSLSRREWFWGVTKTAAAAAAAAIALPASATAATTAALSTKPPALVTSAAVCDPTVSIWTRGNRIIYLLGTAHISEGSAKLAGQLVRDVVPEGVFVELDLKRVGGLGPGAGRKPGASSVSDKMALDTTSTTTASSSIVGNSDATENTSVPASIIVVPTITAAVPVSPALPGSIPDAALPIIPAAPEPRGLRAKVLNFGASKLGGAIQGMYKNLDQQGFKPGEEFVLAVQEGQKIGSAIILGDQDVELTLRRLVQALAATDLNKLMDPNSDVNRSMQELLPTSPAGSPNQDVSKDEFSGFIETMKTRDNVRQIMGQLKEVAPQLVQVMLTERDAYMAAGLNTLNQFHSIVAVMGIAHVDGVERNLKSEGWKQVTPNCPKR